MFEEDSERRLRHLESMTEFHKSEMYHEQNRRHSQETHELMDQDDSCADSEERKESEKMVAQAPEAFVEDDSKMQPSPTMAQLHNDKKRFEEPPRIAPELSISDNDSFIPTGARSPSALSAVASGQSVDFVTVKRMIEQEQRRREQVELGIRTDWDRKWAEELKYRQERDVTTQEKRERKDREKANLRQMQDEATARRRAQEDEELRRFREKEDNEERQRRYEKDLQE